MAGLCASDGRLGMTQHVEPARRFRLRTVGGVLTELSRVYRAGWSGTMTWQDAASAARILREIRNAIEGGELEQRIVRLEARIEAAKPNGSTRPGAPP
jgi:hypothetical protein